MQYARPTFTLAERIMHMSQRFTLTALRSALLRGEPWMWNIAFHSEEFLYSFILTFKTEIFGKLCSVFHSLLMYSIDPTITTCLSSWKWKFEALRGITRFLRPIRGLSGSAKRQTTTWPFRTVIAAWLRSCKINSLEPSLT